VVLEAGEIPVYQIIAEENLHKNKRTNGKKKKERI